MNFEEYYKISELFERDKGNLPVEELAEKTTKLLFLLDNRTPKTAEEFIIKEQFIINFLENNILNKNKIYSCFYFKKDGLNVLDKNQIRSSLCDSLRVYFYKLNLLPQRKELLDKELVEKFIGKIMLSGYLIGNNYEN